MPGGSASAPTTASLLFSYLLDAKGGVGLRDECPVTDAHREAAEATIAWAIHEISPITANDYLYNLWSLAERGIVNDRHFGLVAAMVGTHLRHLGQIEEQKRTATVSDHFGEIKKRAIYDLRVTNVHTFEGMYGVTHLHVMVDPNGNRAVWKSSGERLGEGKTYRLKATVKAHSEFRGAKQTELTRCAVIEELAS